MLALRNDGTSTDVRYADAADLEPVQVRFVSGNYFSLLGIHAAAGRLLVPDDDRAQGASPVAVLRYEYWNQRFAHDPSVLGKTAEINGLQVTIVGVVQPGFFGVVVGSLPDFWIPLTAYAHPSTDDASPP